MGGLPFYFLVWFPSAAAAPVRRIWTVSLRRWRRIWGEDLECAQSFKVESKRSDKAFPLTSIGISQEIGGRLAEAHPHLQVDVHRPQYTVYVEVRDLAAYVHGPAEPGAGACPLA